MLIQPSAVGDGKQRGKSIEDLNLPPLSRKQPASRCRWRPARRSVGWSGAFVEHSLKQEGFWQTVFVELQKRGLKQMLIVCSDNLTGIDQALAVNYPSAEHLPCVVHQIRSSLQHVPWIHRAAVARVMKGIDQTPSYESAELALAEFRQEYQSRYPEIVHQSEVFLPRIASMWNYSPGLRRMVYTTNPQENINRQVRNLTKNRAQMPSIDSAMRLLTLVLRDINERSLSWERARPDWTAIVRELHIHFVAALPNQWGPRS
ncbi:MAG: transposase [Chlorobi bacterium]|nr:transposase [Chlorobiota bacterium]